MRSLHRYPTIAVISVLAMLALPSKTADMSPGDPPSPPLAPIGTSVVRTTILRPRDTIEMALERGGVSRRDAREISAALRRKVNLRRLAPGEQLAIKRGPNGDLLAVVHQRSALERYELRPEPPPRRGDGANSPTALTWSAHVRQAAIETRVDAVVGQLEDSLFASVERLGEGPMLTAKFVALFEWDFDFAADSLPGDEFRILVEKHFAADRFVSYGAIVAAEYRSADRPPLSVVRFSDSDGSPRYYDFQGRATRKMFLRAPLEFTRITSGYSHTRKHPILGGLRPHLALDYGAPTGTPVRAVADGVVTTAGRAGGYGLSVTIRHARGFESMYNHLSRIVVRRGQRVHQRTVIGHVGATGLATGPHLDYRLRKNGRLVNPLSETFLPGDMVSRERTRAFRMHVRSLRDRLEFAETETGAVNPASR
jgi:murein DD-endopeptidase MepM/ murein hydrolase activator NlpD